MGHVYVDQIGQEKAEVGHAGVVLQGHAVHVLAKAGEVVALRKEVDQFVERLSLLSGQIGPRLVQAEQGRGLECGEDGELRVQVVQLVELLGHLDEVRHRLGPQLHGFRS